MTRRFQSAGHSSCALLFQRAVGAQPPALKRNGSRTTAGVRRESDHSALGPVSYLITLSIVINVERKTSSKETISASSAWRYPPESTEAYLVVGRLLAISIYTRHRDDRRSNRRRLPLWSHSISGHGTTHELNGVSLPNVPYRVSGAFGAMGYVSFSILQFHLWPAERVPILPVRNANVLLVLRHTTHLSACGSLIGNRHRHMHSRKARRISTVSSLVDGA